MAKKQKRIHGVSAHRYKDNPEEKRFADAWARQNDEGKTLAYLLYPGATGHDLPPPPNDRDQVVAATVVQWLGSPVGYFFLTELGYVKKDWLAGSEGEELLDKLGYRRK